MARRTKNARISITADQEIMISTRQANKLREGHIRVFDSVMLELSRLNLTGQDHRVLWILLGTMEFENLIIINQTVIAGMLGIHRSAISRSITRLKEADILRQCGKIGVLDKYMVSPYLAIKSRNSKIGQVVDMWEELPQVDQKLRLV